MRFNMPEESTAPDSEELRIGNVYRCKGGGKTRYWIVIGLDDKMTALVGINADGIITSCTSYGRHVFESHGFGRKCLGRCEGIDKLEFDIVWKDE